MTARLYRLTEIHQRVDEHLRREMTCRVPDRWALARLTAMKLRVKQLIDRIVPQPSMG